MTLSLQHDVAMCALTFQLAFKELNFTDPLAVQLSNYLLSMLNVIDRHHDNKARQLYDFRNLALQFRPVFNNAIKTPQNKQETLQIVRLFYECCIGDPQVYELLDTPLRALNTMLTNAKI